MSIQTILSELSKLTVSELGAFIESVAFKSLTEQEKLELLNEGQRLIAAAKSLKGKMGQ
jgi:hypothetical protein